MADSHPPQPTSSPPAKTRSPVERVLVWGLIGLLLVAAAIEFQSRSSHQKVLTALQDKIAEVDKNPAQPEVTEADVRNALGDRKPDRIEEFGGAKLAPNGAKRLEVYTWFTLNPTSQRELWVWYGAEGANESELATVIEVQGGGMISEMPKSADVADSPGDANVAGAPGGAGGMRGPPGNMMGGPGGGPGGRGMGGPGGARGRPGAGGPAAHDADKPNGETSDADQPADKATADDKTGDDKTGDATEEKADDKADKADANNE